MKLKVIFCSFGSKNVIWNGYVFPSSSFSRRDSSEPNSEMCASPATPSSMDTSAPYWLNLITTPFTITPFLYFFEAFVQGFSLRALIESEIFPSFTSITFTFTESPILYMVRGSLTSPQSISEI